MTMATTATTMMAIGMVLAYITELTITMRPLTMLGVIDTIMAVPLIGAIIMAAADITAADIVAAAGTTKCICFRWPFSFCPSVCSGIC